MAVRGLDFEDGPSILVSVRFCRLLAASCVLFPAVARAGEPPLEWSGPTECATSAEMASAVGERLGTAEVELTDLRVAGRAEREGAGWVATLVLRDAEGAEMGERRVHTATASCRALDGPVSLVIAMMLRQHLTKADFVAPPPFSPPPALPLEPIPRVRLVASPRHETHMSWTASTSYVVSFGVMPTVGMGVAGRVDNRVGSVFGVALEVAALGAASVHPFSNAPGAVAFSMLEVGLGFHLAVLRAKWIELGPEAAVRAGVVWAEGVGFDANQTDVSAMVSIGAGAMASMRLVSGLRVEIVLEAAIPLVHDTYEATRGSELATLQNAPVAARLEMGLAWRFE
jgi:hypothetical protein